MTLAQFAQRVNNNKNKELVKMFIIRLIFLNFLFYSTNFAMLLPFLPQHILTKKVAKKFEIETASKSEGVVETLGAYNTELYNKSLAKLCVMGVAALVGGYCVYSIWDHQVYTDTQRGDVIRCEKPFACLVTGACLMSCLRAANSAWQRGWVINNLANISSVSFFNKVSIEQITQQDIANNLARMTIAPIDVQALNTNHFKKKWNINGNETLARVLRGEYNTPEHILYIEKICQNIFYT
jgi:hypothetical protein